LRRLPAAGRYCELGFQFWDCSARQAYGLLWRAGCQVRADQPGQIAGTPPRARRKRPALASLFYKEILQSAKPFDLQFVHPFFCASSICGRPAHRGTASTLNDILYSCDAQGDVQVRAPGHGQGRLIRQHIQKPRLITMVADGE